MKIYCPYFIIKCQIRTIGSQILPTSDRQVRPLVPLEPEQQGQAKIGFRVIRVGTQRQP
ncbi:hypothetical protein LC593_06170 [Nostoc sp. CHAB 5844]|nr:hypothetical protein [Nostoc sp. CHAB 5844]